MPLSEFLRLAVEKLESAREKQCLADTASRIEKNLTEFSHEDGHFTFPNDTFLSNGPSPLGSLATSRIGKFGGIVPTSNISPWPVDVSWENDAALWRSYPVTDEHFLNFLHLSRGPTSLIGAEFTSHGEIPPESFGAEQITENRIRGKDDEDRTIEMNTTTLAKWVPPRDGAVEPIGLSSSVGSGNSGDRVSSGQTKRIFGHMEEMGSLDEDIGTQSVSGEKSIPARKTNKSKRGRTAEIHNLSEKRRRRMINEKMHAFLELVPNCSKSDKATMLDEAIEYLKSLKHQVQILTIEAGLCGLPTMTPDGTQPANVPIFPQMGFGTGFGTPPGPTNTPGILGSDPPADHGRAGPWLGSPNHGPDLLSLAGGPASVSTALGVLSLSGAYSDSMKLSSKDSECTHGAEAGRSIRDGSSQMEAADEVGDRSVVGASRSVVGASE